MKKLREIKLIIFRDPKNSSGTEKINRQVLTLSVLILHLQLNQIYPDTVITEQTH